MSKYHSNKDRIYEALLNDIINLKVKPGEYVKEVELSARFHTSRTPLREVIKRLAHEKYIDVIPRHGNKVSLININYVKQMIKMRIVLETAVIKNMILKYKPEDLCVLRTILTEQETIVSTTNLVEDFWNLDNQFHKALFLLDDKEIWWETLRKFEPHYMRFRKLDMTDLNQIELLYVHHKNIIKAVERREPEAIEEIIHSHVNICLDRVPILLEKYPHYFTAG